MPSSGTSFTSWLQTQLTVLDPILQKLELFSYQIRCGDHVIPSHKEIQFTVFLQIPLSQLRSRNHPSVTSGQRGTSKGQRDPRKCQSIPGTGHNRTIWEISQLVFPGKQVQYGDFSHIHTMEAWHLKSKSKTTQLH